MTTLAIMKTRVADELVRSDLTAMIGYAISDAIAAYQSKRLFFNESRDVTFDTSPAQEFYDQDDNDLIPNLMKIDYVRITIGGVLWELNRAEPQDLEAFSPANGQPTSYTYYGQQIRLYPIPNDVWEVRVAAHVGVSAPASDTEKYNPWMTYAERLIRARAKRELAINVNASGHEPGFSPQAIVIFKMAEDEAFSELKSRTTTQVGTGRIKSY